MVKKGGAIGANSEKILSRLYIDEDQRLEMVENIEVLLKGVVITIDALKHADRIGVKRYGFVIKNGPKDYFVSEIHVIVIKGDVTNDVTLSSWSKQEAVKDWVILDDVKTKPEAIEKLFVMALK
jgi:hypothetical protein